MNLTQCPGGLQARNFVPRQPPFRAQLPRYAGQVRARRDAVANVFAKLDRTVHDAAFGDIRVINCRKSADGVRPADRRALRHQCGRAPTPGCGDRKSAPIAEGGRRRRIDLARERRAVLRASSRILEARIVEPFRFAERAAEIRPMPIVLDHPEVIRAHRRICRNSRADSRARCATRNAASVQSSGRP